MTERGRFLKGTIILICANAAAKILGAVFKIPLTYILEEEGMAVYNTAFSVYIMMLGLVTGGFPFALTKLLAEYTALGKDGRIRPAVCGTGAVLFLLGAAGSLILYIFAPVFAAAMREENAAGAIRAISPAVFLVACGAVIKSSNEARADLLPTAFSQVTEAAFKLICGYFLAVNFARYSVYSAAKGAIWGVTAGEAFATVLLVTVWRVRVRKLDKGRMTGKELKSICSIAFPLMICTSAIGMLAMVEVPVIRGALGAVKFSQKSAEEFLINYAPYTNVFDNLASTLRLSEDGVRKLYGAFSGYAQTIFNLPAGIISTICAAATPMIAKALTKKDNLALKRAVERVLGLIFLLSIPAASMCFFFAEELLELLFGNSFSAPILRAIAPAMIFLCAGNLFVAIMHLSGRIGEPFCVSLIGLLLKILLLAVLIRIPEVNILGTGLSSIVSSVAVFLMLLALMKKRYGINLRVIRLAAPGAAASCVMVGIMYLIRPFMQTYFLPQLAFILSALPAAAGFALTAALLLKRGDTVVVFGKKD